MTLDSGLELLIGELGQKMGLGHLALDAEGACALRFDGRAIVGATLSLSGDEPAHVVLALSVPWRDLNGIDLAAKLETFLNTVEDWEALIADRGGDEGGDTSATGDARPLFDGPCLERNGIRSNRHFALITCFVA
jgi:hypothetical protein